MSRLDKATRDYIIGRAFEKAGIPALENKLEAQLYDWADRLRVHTNGMSDAELDVIAAKIAKLRSQLPEGLGSGYSPIRKDSCCYPNLGGLRVGRYSFSPEGDSRYAVCRPTVPSNHPLALEWHSIEGQREELADRREVIRAQVESITDSVTTIKKLLEVWPEARELLPPNEQPVISNVPAVLISSLNAAIGLPTEGEAACPSK